MTKMKKILALLMAVMMVACLCACGDKGGDDTKLSADSVGTGKIEQQAGETLADVGKLKPAANLIPSNVNMGVSKAGDRTVDAWYADGVRGENYIYFDKANNSSCGLAYMKVESGQLTKTVICAETEENHLVDEESPAGQSAIDIVFYDEFKAYDYASKTWYVRGNPDTIAQLFVGRELANQDDPTNTIILKGDGTGTEVFDGTEDALTWKLDSASTVSYNDGDHEFTLELVCDEGGNFVSLNEQNFRIFVPATVSAEAPAEG